MTTSGAKNTGQSLVARWMKLGPDEGPVMAATAIARAVDQARDETAAVGSKVGRYVLVEPLGAGGMGVVYRAYDPKLRREVAIKHIRSQASDWTGDQTLVREARAMAQLRHRHVVSVFDVEVSQDGVFLVMELVPGPDARVWLRTTRSPREILDLFVAAGEGLASAHAAGLVHRDFKPANVLVDPDTGGRVSDFGLAKAVVPRSGVTQPQRVHPSSPGDGDLAADESTKLSSSPSCVGTPRYMAPEQHRGEHVDARADQFAFCVALWEALTGESPYRGDVRRLARAKTDGPPPWPRTRGVAPWVAAALRRGLSPAPEDRFASMPALLRHLQPRRTRMRAGAVAIAAATGVALVVGTADASTPPCRGASSQMVQTWNDETRHAVQGVFDASTRAYAAPVRELVLSRFDDFAAEWIAERHDACEATAVRREQSERVLDLRMECLDDQRESFDDLIGALVTSGDEAALLGHRAVASLPRAERCADGGTLARDPQPTDRDQADAVASLERELDELRTRMVLGQVDETRARALLEQAVALRWVPVEAKARSLLSYSLARTRDLEAAAAEGEQAWRLALQSDAPVLAAQAGSVAGAMLSVDNPGQGVRLAAAALDLAIGRELPQWLLAALHANLGNALFNAGETARAAEHFRESVSLHTEFGSNRFELASSMTDLARALHRQGRNEEALELSERAASLAAAVLGPVHPDVLRLRLTWVGALASVGRVEQAIGEHRSLVAAAERTLGSTHLTVGEFASSLALRLALHDHGERAEAMARKALEILIARTGEHSSAALGARTHLGAALFRQGRYAESAAEHRRVLELAPAGASRRDIAISRYNLGEALVYDGDGRTAKPLLDLALATVSAEVEPELYAMIQTARAEGLALLQQDSEARDAAAEAWRIAMQPQRSVRLTASVARVYSALLRGDGSPAAAGVVTAARARCLAAGARCSELDRTESP